MLANGRERDVWVLNRDPNKESPFYVPCMIKVEGNRQREKTEFSRQVGCNGQHGGGNPKTCTIQIDGTSPRCKDENEK